MTFAVYYEMVRGQDTVNQHIFVPACALSNRQIAPTLWHRQIDPAHPRRTWSKVQRSNFVPLRPGADIDTAMEHNIEQFEGLSSHMRTALSDPGFEVQGVFAFELSDSDKFDIMENASNSVSRVPNGILAEVRRMRGDLNLPNLPGE